MTDLTKALARIDTFRAGALGTTIANVEAKLTGAAQNSVASKLIESGIDFDLLLSALLVKKASSQIGEIVHALGIVLALPKILESNEIVESLSLAAGNTGKGFDLETDRRIAEFTFIQWQGGPEVVRQNKIFKDFYFLAEEKTQRRRELYTIGLAYPKKFFESGRGISQILRSNAKLGKSFQEKYGNQYVYVRDYYLPRRDTVAILDICGYVPYLKDMP